MKAYDYEAVVYDGDTYCLGCAPAHANPTVPGECTGSSDCDECYPIFADSEWDAYPTCSMCGYEHDYVCLTAVGRAALARDTEEEKEEANG